MSADQNNDCVCVFWMHEIGTWRATERIRKHYQLYFQSIWLFKWYYVGSGSGLACFQQRCPPIVCSSTPSVCAKNGMYWGSCYFVCFFFDYLKMCGRKELCSVVLDQSRNYPMNLSFAVANIINWPSFRFSEYPDFSNFQWKDKQK